MKVYEALKSIGFRETIWQIVYKGQIGGLVKLIDGGLYEIHVRFYITGSIEAELEVGRNFISHFFAPRYQAENIVLNSLKEVLEVSVFKQAEASFRNDSSIIDFSEKKRRLPRISYAVISWTVFFTNIFFVFQGWLPSYTLIGYIFIFIMIYFTLPRCSPAHSQQ